MLITISHALHSQPRHPRRLLEVDGAGGPDGAILPEVHRTHLSHWQAKFIRFILHPLPSDVCEEVRVRGVKFVPQICGVASGISTISTPLSTTFTLRCSLLSSLLSNTLSSYFRFHHECSIVSSSLLVICFQFVKVCTTVVFLILRTPPIMKNLESSDEFGDISSKSSRP